MGGKKAVHEFTNLCIKCYLWVLFLRFVAMKLQYSGRNNIKTHCSIFWDNSVQVRCLSQKEFSFIWFLINGFSFPFVISHCVQIFILMWQTTHNLVLLQEGFVYIDTDEISQIKSRKSKYHLFIDWLIDLWGGTLHSPFQYKHQAHTHDIRPRRCYYYSYWESQTHSALVSLPRCCHCFQRQLKGNSHSEGEHGSVTHGVQPSLAVFSGAVSSTYRRTLKYLHSIKLICLTSKTCSALCKEGDDFNLALSPALWNSPSCKDVIWWTTVYQELLPVGRNLPCISSWTWTDWGIFRAKGRKVSVFTESENHRKAEALRTSCPIPLLKQSHLLPIAQDTVALLLILET